MLEIPYDEAVSQLVSVNIAINNLIIGKRITSLKVGSSHFAREYKYGEVTLEGLKEYRNELLEVIQGYTPEAAPTFNTNRCFQIVVSKR